MFDNVAFNVVLGLILIYLLYSLLVTILSEMTATYLGFRQRMLRLCIERMLNDGYYDHGLNWWGKQWNNILRTFLYEFRGFKYSVAGRFYNDPGIKYLAKGDKISWISFRQSKPSYISKDTFALTLIHLMRDKGTGKTDVEKIEFCLQYNTLHFQPDTLRNIKTMWTDSGKDLALFGEKLKKWFEESMERNTGWYKRKMQVTTFFIGLLLAMVFNVDSIKITRILSRDKEARGQLVNLAVGLSKDTTIKNASAAGTDGAPVPAAVIDSSLAHVSQDIGQANYILGLGWGLDRLGNVQTDSFCKSDDSLLYSRLSAMRVKVNRLDSLQPLIRDLGYRQKMFLRRVRLRESLGSVPSTDKDLLKDKDSLLTATHRLDSFLLITYLDDLRPYSDLHGQLDSLTGRNYTSIDSIGFKKEGVDSFAIVQGLTPYSFWQKANYWRKHVFASGLQLLGFLLTALALSMGAPFWFDMLSKIVSIRGAGVRPPTKKDSDKNDPSPDILIKAPPLGMVPSPSLSPLAQAVQDATTALAGVNGLLSVDEGMVGKVGEKVDAIEIHVADKAASDKVTGVLGTVFKTFPVNVLVTSLANVHAGEPGIGGTLINKTKVNGRGSLGCFLVKNNAAPQYLMSCWHVLKGDRNWDVHAGPDIITDGVREIARLVDGCLSSNMDVGFAELQGSGFTNGFTKGWRVVDKEDVNQQMKVKFHGSHSGPVEGAYIFNDSVTITGGLEYPDAVRRVLVDMFSITILIDGVLTSPSKKGDSGALVLDDNDVPIGILVGGDQLFTYIAKFSNILAADGIFREYKLLT